jgi:5'-3' exoribonuclease 2
MEPEEVCYFLSKEYILSAVPALLFLLFMLCSMAHLFFFQVVYTPGQQDKCFLCGQVGHLAANCEGKVKRKAGEFDEKGDAIVPKKPYQVICLS